MDFLTNYIVHEAEERIVAGRILSSANLTSFLQAASNRDGLVAERDLIDAALQKGLYADLGRKYQSRLNAVIDAARGEIAVGSIQTAAQLRSYLEAEAPKVVGGSDPLKIERDLLIDARQGGLYKLLTEVQYPKALSTDVWAA
jgi:hypothetical protein